MDMIVGLSEMLVKMLLFAVFAFAGIILGVSLRKKKNLKLEKAAAGELQSEEE